MFGQDTVARYGFPRPKRKVIVYGWQLGFTDVKSLRRNAGLMQRQPFDGIMFSLFYNGHPRDHAFIHSTRLSDADFAPAAKELAAIKWTTFTDNFLVVKAGERFLLKGEPGRLDWFDDQQWKNIYHNIAVVTRVAVKAKCVGLAFDPEPYHAAIWNYDQAGSRKPQIHRNSKSFAQYSAVVRRRGAEFMRAIQAEMPKVRIFNLYQAVRIPPSKLAESIYSLYPAFINGMLDAAKPTVKFIDGNEYGFSLLTRADYTNAYVNVKERKLALIDPKNRGKYRNQVQVSVPLYLDDIFGSHKHRRWIGTYLSTASKRRLFEHKLFQALDSVDEYVWVYGERVAWFHPQRVPRWAAGTVKEVKEKVNRLRLEKRPTNESLMSLVRSQMSLRKRENSTLSRSQQATPRVTLPKANIERVAFGREPIIDGKFRDACWGNMDELRGMSPLLFFVRDHSEVRTHCKAIWSGGFLYLAFTCEEPRIAEIQKRSKGEGRGNRTTLVLSLPDGRFIRIDAPLFDRPRLMTRSKGKGWKVSSSKGIKVARQFRKTSWTAEWQVPWKLLGGPPKPGDQRRATVTRVRAPWTEHDSWAPQIDPNLIDDHLLGTWTFK